MKVNIFAFYLLTILMTWRVLSQSVITGHLDEDQSEQTDSIDISTYPGSSVIQIKFSITNGVKQSATAFIATLNPSSLDDDYFIYDYYHQNPAEDNFQYDLDAMWDFRDQYMNLNKRGGNTDIHYKVINYDPDYRRQRIQYKIQVGPPNQNSYQCAPCENGGQSNSQCKCRNCEGGNSGRSCSRFIQTTEQDQFQVPINGFQIKHYRLPAQDMTISINIDFGLIQVYVQLETFENQAATYYNVAIGQSSQGKFTLIPGTQGIRVSVNTNEKAVLVTFVSLSNMQTHSSVKIDRGGEVASVLVIVMGVLGGLLLIALIVAAVCIIRKTRQNNSRISSEMILPSDNGKLTGDQIQRFFPTCIFSEVIFNGQNSINELNNKEQNLDHDCVICLETIKPEDSIKMGFCRHVFHSNCLIGWFKKQRNCPYCRKQYNRNDTLTDYNKLLQDTGNKALFNIDLVKQIYKSKSNISGLGTDEKMAVINMV